MNSLNTLVTLLLLIALINHVTPGKLKGLTIKLKGSVVPNENDEDLDGETTKCIICADRKPNKKIGPCEHKFCKECIYKLKETVNYKCPCCRETYTSDRRDARFEAEDSQTTNSTNYDDSTNLGPNDNIHEEPPSPDYHPQIPYSYPSDGQIGTSYNIPFNPHMPMPIPIPLGPNGQYPMIGPVFPFHPNGLHPDDLNGSPQDYRIIYLDNRRPQNPILNNLANMGNDVLNYIGSYFNPTEEMLNFHNTTSEERKEKLISDLTGMGLSQDEINMIVADTDNCISDNIRNNSSYEVCPSDCGGNLATCRISLNCKHKYCELCADLIRKNISVCPECGAAVMDFDYDEHAFN
ncbi:uncharacterized protein LOC126907305 isoform X2 [Daktulosphaira vitifoliae]|uniref:uncharacterized protein LOC126907305 isoform X2 n=1 Tax=Daktulosphaira vitifoliae TaxID=58002 RepID=UPI0021A9F129|nr:uncharacterized protein LOC126907305 isoform X2 [Daktulosphaira vitifoliae]